DETVDSLRQATTAESTAPAEDPPSETDPPEDTTGDAPTGQAAGAFCERMATFAEASDDAENALGADFDLFEDDFSDAELYRFKEGVAEADALFAGATAAAPPQIRDDMALMASMCSALSEKIAQADSAEELFGALFSLAFEEFDE